MKYFVILNDEKVGPLSLEEVMNLGISRKTLVWKSGMQDWTQSNNLIEFKQYFSETPPELINNEVTEYSNQKWESIRFVVFISIFISILSSLIFYIIFYQLYFPKDNVSNYEFGFNPMYKDQNLYRQQNFFNDINHKTKITSIISFFISLIGSSIYRFKKND